MKDIVDRILKDIGNLLTPILAEDFTAALLFAYELRRYGSIKDFSREDIYFSGIPLIKDKNVLGFTIEVFSMDAREIIFNVKQGGCICN